MSRFDQAALIGDAQEIVSIIGQGTRSMEIELMSKITNLFLEFRLISYSFLLKWKKWKGRIL